MKDKIRPIYSELQGYLAQAPEIKSSGDMIMDEPAFWGQHNATIDELNQVTGDDYNRYKVSTDAIPWNGKTRQGMDIQTYRTKLGGLISRLHGLYFSDEMPPFSGMPSTVINQHQTQNQNVQVLLEVQSKIDEKLAKLPDGNEKTFLQKVKSSLLGISNITELMSLIFKVATELGLTTTQVHNLFK